MMRYLCGWVLVIGLTACSEPPPPPSPSPSVAVAIQSPSMAALTELLNAEQDAHLRRVAVGARGFQDAVDGLLGDPQDERLATAREAWAHLYRVFNEAAVVLLCRAAADPALAEALSRTDLFPILPGYIDGLKQWPGSGIVNDVSVELSRDALLAEQGARSREEASIGFQVLAFLLQGEPGAPRQVLDLQPVTAPSSSATLATTDAVSGAEQSDAAEPAESPAASAHDQWEQAESVWREQDQPANRRRHYLRLTSRILVQDLLTLASDRSAASVGAHCPLDALRRTTERLIRAEGLSGHTDVEGEYYAAASRDIAVAGLGRAITPWLAEQSPLRDWLGAVALPVWSPAAQQDMAALQQLHAALSASMASAPP